MKKLIIKKYEKKLIFIFVAIIIGLFFLIYSKNKFWNYTKEFSMDNAVLLESNQTVIQEISGKNISASGLSILFGTYGRDNIGDLQVDLYENSKLIKSWNCKTILLKDNQYHNFELDREVELSSKKKYQIVLKDTYEGNNGIAVWTTNNEKYAEPHICFKWGYIEKGLRRVTHSCAMILFVAVILMVLGGVKEIIIMATILFSLGIFYLLSSPVGSIPDEQTHFYRAFEISCGNMVSQHLGESGAGGNVFPVELSNYANRNAELDWDNTTEYEFTNASLYSPVSYLPQVIGIKVARLITNKVFWIFYGGRLGNFLVSMILLVLAIYFIPFGRKTIFLVMVFPLTLQEMISMSPDGFTTSLSLFLLSYVLYLSYKKNNIDSKEIIILGLAGVILSLCKIVYVVLLLLIFMIPAEKIGNAKKSRIVKGAIVGGAILINFVWLSMATDYLVEFHAGVDVPAQIKFVITHLWTYYEITVKTIMNNSEFYISTMMGYALGALNVITSPIVWISFFVLFLYEMLGERDVKVTLHKYDTLILLLTFLGGVALVITSLYVQWTPYQNDVVIGVQGRYFTPIIATLAMWAKFSLKTKEKSNNYVGIMLKEGSYYYILVITLNGIALLDLMSHYL